MEIVLNDHTLLCNHSQQIHLMSKIRIMIINDSLSIRCFLEEVIKSYPDCEISSSHLGGSVALKYIKFKKPDVIILDLEMPNMDGLSFLEKLPSEKIPTIIFSSYVKNNPKLINDALNLGAIDSLAPAVLNSQKEIKKFKNVLHHKIVKASLKSNRYSLRACYET